MNQAKDFFAARKGIALRFVYTLFFFVVLEILKTFQILISCAQFLYLFATKKTLEPLRTFSDRLSVLSYRVMRYITLNENQRPFPFSEFPESLDPVESVYFEGEK